MKRKRQIALAVCITVGAHLLFAGAATALLAMRAAAPPDNDRFARAAPLGSRLAVSAFGDNFHATRELHEPAHGGSVQGGSVWWTWKAPELCGVELQVNSAEFEHVAAVYRGAVLQTLVECVGRKPGSAEPLRFVAEADTEYLIAVAGAGAGDAGVIKLNLRADPGREVAKPEEELVMLLPEMFVLEERQETERQRAFVPLDHIETGRPPPDEADFESDRDSRAAAELPPDPAGELGVPSVDGVELPFAELAESEYVDSENDDRNLLPVAPQWRPAPATPPSPATASAASVESSPADASPRPPVPDVPPTTAEGAAGSDREPAAAVEQLRVPSIFDEPAEDPDALGLASERSEEAVDGVADTPSAAEPPAERSSEPAPAPAPAPAESTPPTPPGETADAQGEVAPAFRPEDLKRRVRGTLSNLGEASPDVAATPLGAYKRRVNRAVERSWRRQYNDHADLAGYGSLRITCVIDRQGRIVDMEVGDRNCNAVVLNFSVLGVRGADIPPMPAELFGARPDARLVFDFNIILY